MTVQELLDIINKIEDKSTIVQISIEGGRSTSISDEVDGYFDDNEERLCLYGDETDYS